MSKKTVILLRHAKSAWDDPSAADIDRPLNERGRRDAPRMGRWLVGNGLEPDQVLCSTAVRTRETWDLIAPCFRSAPPVSYRKSLYLAEPPTLLAEIRRVPAATRTLLLLGHNPGLELLAQVLVAQGDAEVRAALAEKFPTAAAAVIAFEDTTFADIAPDIGRLVAFMAPKRLP
jgi:phosphohistidine phosphatase